MRLKACFLSALLGLATLGSARAQPTTAPAAPLPTPTGWQFSVTPYGWFPALRGTLQTPLPRVGDRSVDIGAGSVLTNLASVPIMAAGEARYGRFALLADIFWAGIDQDLRTRDALFDGGHTIIRSTIANLVGLVRVVETPGQSVEVGGGTRIWAFSNKVSMNPGLLPGAIVRSSASWADPIVAGRYQARLSPQLGATVYADIGGFDTGSRLTWQVLGTLDYALTDKTTLRAGWRYLMVDKTRGSFGVDLGFNGPFLAASFRF